MSQFLLSRNDIAAPSGYLKYLAGRWQHVRKIKKERNQNLCQLVAYPEPHHRIRKELQAAQHLGNTPDGKSIYLFDYRINSSVIRELGRLRELTFRAVGEGTQKLRDIDEFDKTYRHIVLWDDNVSAIVGAYRVGEAFKLTANSSGASQLYTSRLFNYQSKFDSLFPNAIELGRSFIQPKYWTKRGLDYLWTGIGAYLQTNPKIRYLFGAVSISNEFPSLAKQQIVSCYQYYFQPEDYTQYATARVPFQTNRGVFESFRDQDFSQSTRMLKRSLQKQGVTLPTLYKHYSGLCDAEGIAFIDFNIDPEFSYCIDGLMLVDLAFIKDKKRRRYLDPHD